MNMKRFLFVLSPSFILACGGNASESNLRNGTNVWSSTEAALHVSLGASDTPTIQGSAGQGNGKGGTGDVLKAAIVHIDEVTAHVEGTGWVELLSTDDLVEVDVLKLASHTVDLGLGNIPPGRVTQVRLHVASDSHPYVLTSSDTQVALKVPSGSQSGIKIKGNWDIGPCATATIALELAGKNALKLHTTGHEDLWILRPVIKTKRVRISGTCNDDDLQGTPTGDDGTPSDDDDDGASDGASDGSGDPDLGSGNDDGSGTDDGSGGSSDGSPSDGGSSSEPPMGCTTSFECGTYEFCTLEGTCGLLPDV
ncbi:MAG: DUF4382 domain-containing protein [Deltaproteobacteria bacterium]|nr:DUF4382 domain-containing protein [Deltaproteobacteria bacterium]